MADIKTIKELAEEFRKKKRPLLIRAGKLRGKLKKEEEFF